MVLQYYTLFLGQQAVRQSKFVVKFRNYIEKQFQSYDVYLVSDRYREYITKGVTRVSRGAQFSRVHQLTAVMPIPTPKVILTIPDNKRQRL